jgi:hypothetical protein
MPLQEEIDKTRQEIRTDGYSMSIGEWISLYENNEIEIHPAFQRFFRWSDYQKSTLVESILLGIPIPPIFVSQREDGIWDVVDGVQRLSTVYEFVGILKDDQGDTKPPLVLQKTKYLPSLQDKKWDDSEDKENSLSTAQRLLIKRAKISVSIVEKESDEMAKYELFQRLNTGGSTATPQEVRNCVLVMLNNQLHQWMRSMADYEPFRSCIALSDRLYEEQYDMELLLRFVLLFDADVQVIGNLGDVGVFLTDRMIQMALSKNINYEHLEKAFKTTFDILNTSTGDNSFKRYSPEKEKFLGGFIVSAYEVIALGIGYNHQRLPSPAQILPAVKNIWSDKTYKNWSGTGTTAARRLPRLIPYGREVFSSK